MRGGANGERVTTTAAAAAAAAAADRLYISVECFIDPVFQLASSDSIDRALFSDSLLETPSPTLAASISFQININLYLFEFLLSLLMAQCTEYQSFIPPESTIVRYRLREM